MNQEWQTILGNCPSKANTYQIVTIKGHGSLAKTKALRAYENSFYLQCGKYRDAGIDGFFELHIRVFFPSMRSDLDNSLKVVCDCLQKCGAFKNDNRCTKIIAEKFVDKEQPRIEFCLVPVNQN